MNKNYIKIIKIWTVAQIMTFSVSYISRRIMIRYDQSTSLFAGSSFLDHFLSWDALHFANIAQYGYFYEHLSAFFPLVPFMAKITGKIFHCNFLITGIILNNIFFLISSLLIYKISHILISMHYKPFIKKDSFEAMNIKKNQLAVVSSLCFILNPASIIYSVLYTESLFCMLILLGIYFMALGKKFRAATFFSLASLCRSNSVVFIVFFTSFLIPFIIIPLILHQFYFILLYWRNHSKFTLIVPYNYVQKNYWDQGFLKFISMKQKENILVGLPVILFCLYTLKFFKTALINEKIVQFWPKPTIKWIFDPFNSKTTNLIEKLYIVLWFKIFIVITIIHWNMSTRFLSFHPFFYIVLAKLCINRRKKFIMFYILSFRLAYIILFSSYYPPA
ncbi:hypothetical protein NUSPORA_01898 [Nucleospora cyclopteri]